eukprot:Gb_21962 [translate_table: standard]
MDCLVSMLPSISKSTAMPAWTGLSTRSPYFSNTSFLQNAFHHKGKSMGSFIQGHMIQCILTQGKDSSTPILHGIEREPHKYFDQVVITVRSGDGGHGAVLSMPRPTMPGKTPGKKWKNEVKGNRSYRRDSDGTLILPMGGHGGDVVIYADESKDSLLELHQKRRYNAKRGGNVDAMGALRPTLHDGFASPMVRIPVPVGTVVKRKRGGKFLADLAHPRDEIRVARGGRGGISLVEMPQNNRRQLRAVNVNVMRDQNDKAMIFGEPGEEVTLELTLRIVADVGLVGLPNAGKSSLLASVTLAKPDIADYPFTTLMPNLGRLDGDPDLGVWGFSSRATLADLPGLIRGAHLGKGLGRTFLRHLRRTRLLVHVVDASADDPIQDYRTVREELRMYNPDYLERPHMVVLNKLDLPEARERFESLSEQIAQIGSLRNVTGSLYRNDEGDAHMLHLPATNSTEEQGANICSSVDATSKSLKQEKEIDEYSRPLAVVGISALHGIGIVEMLKEIRLAMKSCKGDDQMN